MLMFFNFCPDSKVHQRAIRRSELPSLDQKMEMFHEAAEALQEAGYVRIGYDHFAKPEDELAKAFKERTLHWNSLGYRPGRCVDMIGLGEAASGRITQGPATSRTSMTWTNTSGPCTAAGSPCSGVTGSRARTGSAGT